MEQQFIQYGHTTIEYSLVFDERKTLGIKVYPDKSVQVIAPFETQKDKIKDKILSKAAWIVRQQDFFMSFHPRTPARKYISGETHLYLGKQYRLKVVQSEKTAVKLQGGNIFVHTKDTKNTKQIEKQLKAWYKEKAEKHFEELYKKSQPIAKAIYHGETKLKYRWMDKRWGSCHKDGSILLNLELIKAPKKCIEYVIVHELCHLVHLNHSKAFFDLLEKHAPNWRKTKNELEKIMV